MVIGNTKEERAKAGNRLCPCTPALNEELPQSGACHCTLFCTPEHARVLAEEERLKEVSHMHLEGLSKEACDALLHQKEIDADELEALLEARSRGVVRFNLVDTREWMEWAQYRIKGTDYLVPTTSFYDALAQLKGQEKTPTVVYCYSGSRSAYCQRVLKHLGYPIVVNLGNGIMSYNGEIESGE